MQTRTHTKPGQSHWLGLALALAGIIAMLALAPATRAQTPPGVDSVAPESGSAAGGTQIVITGTDFADATMVTIGGVDILAVDFVDSTDTTITVETPPNAVGLAEIFVTTPDGENPTTDNVFFTYLPEVTDLTPNTGPESGGTLVTIEGAGFTGVDTVTFGGVAGTDLTPVDEDTLTVISPPHAPGDVQVIVTTNTFASEESDAAEFTYTANDPAVTSLEPDSGPTAGGTVVMITGTDFTGATAVTFDVTGSPDFEVIDDTTIRAVAPAHAAGTVFVRVVTPAGTSEDVDAAEFTYVAGLPVITILDPEEGPTSGGTEVTITGSGFEEVETVMFGDAAGTNLDVVSDTSITVTSPANDAGVVFVILQTDGDDSSPTVASQFTYVEGEGPVVTGLDPNEGPAAGGTEVTITGTGFTEDSEVTFGGTDATEVDFVNDTEIVATSPAHAAGVVDVVVTTEEGSSATSDDSEFTYLDEASTITYNLLVRWTLISWLGTDGITVTNALSGTENPDNPDTNSIAGQVTAIYSWNAVQQRWLGNFPNAGNVPGANDFTTLAFGTSYFFAVSSAQNWTVLEGP
jgi:hypothetical protein